MSESASDDAELSRLQRAAEFMAEVRLAQAESGTKMTGRTDISVEQKQAITSAIEKSALVSHVKQSARIDLLVNKLAERFGEMCRRHGAVMDEELRPSVVKLLAAELWVNHKTLGASAEGLLSATLHQGAIAPELLGEFPEQPPYIVSRAMYQRPADTKKFLQWLEAEIAVVSSEREFQSLARTNPSKVALSILHHPSSVRESLRKELEKQNRGRS